MNVSHPWKEAPAAEFAVIGDPVTHSLSPRMHNAAFEKLGLPYRYVAIHVLPGKVSEALHHLAELGYIGVNVTVPHKEEALGWALNAEPLAKRVRAANTLRLTDRSCINTDAPGFMDTLEFFQPRAKTALMLGAGGSARAIAVALVEGGYKLRIHNRTHSKAVALVEELGLPAEAATLTSDPSGVALVVNTTSASLTDANLAVDWRRAEQDAIAYDLMYSQTRTPFLREAASHGLRAVDGKRMLVAQGARSFEWWLDIPAPRDAMLDALQ